MLGRLILSIAVILICSKGFLFYSGSRQDDKRILTLAFIMLVLVLGCQDVATTGSGDVKAYYAVYQHAIESDSLFLFIEDNPYMENGYLVITWLLSKIVRWPQFILFFEAAFCCGITLRFIYIYSEDALLSALGFMSLGLFGFYQTGFRQGMAISICLLALEMAEKGKLCAFILLVLAAISVHQTAVVFLPAYFIMKISVNQLLVIAEIGLLLLMRLIAPFFMSLGNEIFNRDFSMAAPGNKAGGVINIMIGAFVVFTMMYQMGNNNIVVTAEKKCGQSIFVSANSFNNHKFLYLLLLGIGLYTLRYQASIMERISFYYTPMLFILLPSVIRNGFAKKDRRLLVMLFMAGMLFLIDWRFGTRDFLPFWLAISD